MSRKFPKGELAGRNAKFQNKMKDEMIDIFEIYSDSNPADPKDSMMKKQLETTYGVFLESMPPDDAKICKKRKSPTLSAAQIKARNANLARGRDELALKQAMGTVKKPTTKQVRKPKAEIASELDDLAKEFDETLPKKGRPTKAALQKRQDAKTTEDEKRKDANRDFHRKKLGVHRDVPAPQAALRNITQKTKI